MKKVIAVDDDVAMVRLYQLQFRRAGLDAKFFKLGQPFLDEVADLMPDLVVLDYDLPDMKGSDILEGMRRISGLEETPVIFITGQGRQTLRDNLMERGASDVFLKPFSPAMLTKRIKDLLEID